MRDVHSQSLETQLFYFNVRKHVYTYSFRNTVGIMNYSGSQSVMITFKH